MLKRFKEFYLCIYPIIVTCIFFNIYYDGDIIKLGNKESVILVFIFTLLLIDKRILNLKKELIPFYFFLLTCFISTYFSVEQIISLKRFLIIFIPSFIVVQIYSNIDNCKQVQMQIFKYFVYVVFFLCLYSLIIFINEEYVKNLIFFGFPVSGEVTDFKLLLHDVTKTNFFNLGQIYYTRGDLFNDDALGPIGESTPVVFQIYRPSSLLANTIGFSQLVLLALIMLLSKNNVNGNLLRRFLAFTFITFLIWTFSRINILIILLVIPFLYAIINNKKLISIFLLSSTLVFILTVFWIDIAISDLLSNMPYDKSLDLPIGHILDRLQIYDVISENLNLFFLSGIGFGVGFEGFLENFSNSIQLHKHIQELSIPSVPITIFLETGILGLLSFLFVLAYPIYVHTKSEIRYNQLIFLMVAIYFTQFSDISLFRFHPMTFMFCVFLGIFTNKKSLNYG